MEPPVGGLPPAVEGKGRLPVRRDRQQSERRVATWPACVGKERRDRPAPAIPLPPRRHAHHCVLSQKRGEGIDVRILPRTNITFEKRAVLIAWHRSDSRRSGQNLFFQGCAGGRVPLSIRSRTYVTVDGSPGLPAPSQVCTSRRGDSTSRNRRRDFDRGHNVAFRQIADGTRVSAGDSAHVYLLMQAFEVSASTGRNQSAYRKSSA